MDLKHYLTDGDLVRAAYVANLYYLCLWYYREVEVASCCQEHCVVYKKLNVKDASQVFGVFTNIYKAVKRLVFT